MKKILFIAVVLLLVSTISFAGQNSRCGKSSSPTQTTITYVGTSRVTSVSGTGSAWTSDGGCVSSQQAMGTRGSWASQNANAGYSGTGILSSICGYVYSLFSGSASTYQTQSLPSSGGGMPPR